MSAIVEDNPAESRFEVRAESTLAGFLDYRLRSSSILFTHIEVDDAFEGMGLASRLAEDALAAARDAGLEVLPRCPYVAKYIAKHPEHLDLVPASRREEFGLPV